MSIGKKSNIRPHASIFILLIALLLAPLSGCDDNASNTGDRGDTTTGADTINRDNDRDTTVSDTTIGDTHSADTRVDNDTTDTTSPVDTTADTDTTTPPPELSIDHWGGRIHGPILDLTRIEQTLWIGTAAIYDSSTDDVRGGLYRLELDTGVFESFEDQLPRRDLEGFGSGPAPTAAVIEDGERLIVVTRDGLLTRDIAGEDFTLNTLTVNGVETTPLTAALDREGGRANLWVASADGLLRLNPDTLAIEDRYDTTTLGSDSVTTLTVEPSTGAVNAVVRFDDGTSQLVRLLDGIVTATLVPGAGEVPEGFFRDLAWSSSEGALYATLSSWDATTGGVIRWDTVGQIDHVATEGELARGASGEAAAFGAWSLELDEASSLLIVGGRINSEGPVGGLKGGGVAWIDLSRSDDIELQITGLTWLSDDIAGDHVTALAYDPQSGRTFASLHYPCSEFRLGNAGLEAIAFVDGAPRFSSPVLSGVRDVKVIGDKTYAVMRDENPGLACEGVNVQKGLVQLHEDHSGWVLPISLSEPSSFNLNSYAAVALDAWSEDKIVAGSRGDVLFLSTPSGAESLTPALDLGVSNKLYDVAWEDENTLWASGLATHQTNDDANLADVGPRGAARIVLNATDEIESVTHYVLATRDAPGPSTVTGLPSSEVRDVVVTPNGETILICGTERVGASVYDRDEGEPFVLDGSPRLGGVASVSSDGAMTPLLDGAAVPDGRAGAWGSDDALYILDAERGLLRWSDFVVDALELPADPPTGSTPHRLWMGADDSLVATLSTGAAIRLGGVEVFATDVGHTWGVTERSEDVLWIGADEGLLRVYTQDVTPPAETLPPQGAAPPFKVLSRAVACFAQDEACNTNANGCCEGLVCGGSGIVPVCVVESAQCLSLNTPCGGGDPCCAGLTCGGSGIVPACVPI